MTDRDATEPEAADPDGTDPDGANVGERAETDSAGDGSAGETEGVSADEADPESVSDPADATVEPAVEDVDGRIDEDLIERVEESDPQEIAREVASLRVRVEALEKKLEDRDETIADLESTVKRKQADFENYKKRMKKRREEEQRRATEALVSRLLDVRDNLVRALDQEDDADIRSGVASTRRQLDDVLESENVSVVEPSPGDEVDPTRHQVLARVASDQPEGAIADVHRPGYEMANKVIREAQVTVSEGADEATGAETASDADEKTEAKTASDADEKTEAEAASDEGSEENTANDSDDV